MFELKKAIGETARQLIGEFNQDQHIFYSEADSVFRFRELLQEKLKDDKSIKFYQEYPVNYPDGTHEKNKRGKYDLVLAREDKDKSKSLIAVFEFKMSKSGTNKETYDKALQDVERLHVSVDVGVRCMIFLIREDWLNKKRSTTGEKRAIQKVDTFVGNAAKFKDEVMIFLSHQLNNGVLKRLT